MTSTDRRVAVRAAGLLGAVSMLAFAVQAPPALAAQSAQGAQMAAAAPAPAGPVRQFKQVKGDIWRAGNGNWWALVYATPDGILLMDPINTSFATWLKAELATRFPGKPVKYIVYSHSHWDHIGGAGVFADSKPLIIGQERMLGNMDGRYPHFPGDMTDRNDNGMLEAEEVMVPTLQHPGICGGGPQTFAGYDRDKTGHVNFKPQWWALHDIHKPDITYSDRMSIKFGGRTIEFVFPGLNHADDGTVLFFPEEKVAFSTDFPSDALVTTSMKSIPSACGAFDQHPLTEWLKSYHTIEDLDFDILSQGHGHNDFTRADLVAARKFYEDLRDAVVAGMAEGKTLEQLKASVKLPQYKDWRYYDLLMADNVEAAYLNLKRYRQ